jgi:hypothetical protein
MAGGNLGGICHREPNSPISWVYIGSLPRLQIFKTQTSGHTSGSVTAGKPWFLLLRSGSQPLALSLELTP